MIRTLSPIAALALWPIMAASQPSEYTPPKVQTFSAPGPLTCCGGATTETNIAAIRIPGGSMGATGAIDLKCLWSYPNSANIKTLTVRLNTVPGSIGGGVLHSPLTVTTTASTQTEIIIRNITANSQVIVPVAFPFGSFGVTSTSLSLDTTADVYLNINGITASGTETITMNHCYALVTRP
jgi:hypothetical protein